MNTVIFLVVIGSFLGKPINYETPYPDRQSCLAGAAKAMESRYTHKAECVERVISDDGTISKGVVKSFD